MRIRTIKPEFWTHEELSSLPEATHLLAAALLNYADDHGYFNAHPGLIRAACCPLREPSVSIHCSLTQLEEVGYIETFDGTDGKRYGRIVKFAEHQRVNRPSPSKIKGLRPFSESSLNPHGVLTEPSLHDMEQGTGKGTGNREQGKESPRGARAPQRRGTLPELREFAESLGLPASDGEACFHGWEANGWTISGKPMNDWRAAMRNWQMRGWMASQKTRDGPGKAAAKPYAYTQTPTAPDDFSGKIRRTTPEELERLANA